jgi:hypothetical protein
MKELTELGITFSFSYISLDTTRNTSAGLKIVSKALLRKSLRNDQSNQSHLLLSYTDIDNGSISRQCRIALLQSFNEYNIKP